MTDSDGVAPTLEANADARIEVRKAVRSLWRFAFVVSAVLILMFAALAFITILYQIHSQHTLVAHNVLFNHLLTNSCLSLKHNHIQLPSWCLPKK